MKNLYFLWLLGLFACAPESSNSGEQSDNTGSTQGSDLTTAPLTDEPTVLMSDLQVDDSFGYLMQKSLSLSIERIPSSTADTIKLYFDGIDETTLLFEQRLGQPSVELSGWYPARSQTLVAVWFDAQGDELGTQSWSVTDPGHVDIHLNL